MSHNGILVLIVCLLIIALVVGTGIWVLPKTHETDLPETESATDSDTEGTTVISTEEIPTRPPHIDLDEGNEIYFDTELIALLTDMEDSGMEDEVNVILDWLCLLINRFEDQGYSEQAIRQVQRFFFLTRERLLPLGYDTVTEQISRCIPREGANDETTLTAAVKEVLGWDPVGDLSFVFESEVAT